MHRLRRNRTAAENVRSRNDLDTKAGVLVLGDYRQTLAVTRSLTHTGYRVIAGTTTSQPFTYTRYSRYVNAHWQGQECRPNNRTDASQQSLSAILDLLGQQPNIRWIFPVGDKDIRVLCPHVEKLEVPVGIIMADVKVVEACTDKTIAYEKAQKCGLPVPSNATVNNPNQLIEAVKETGYPCVVKPFSERFEIGGEKARILRSDRDFDEYFEKWPDNNVRLMVQGFAEGKRHNCQFLADKGQLLAYFENIVLRTTRSNGTGYGTDCLSVPPSPRLRGYCETLLMDLNYSGVGCVQFLVDEQSGSVNFLEINPRLDATCALAVRCGYDFPLMALEYARYRRGLRSAPPRIDSPYRKRRAVWILGEIEGLGHELRRHKISVREAWHAFGNTFRSAMFADVHLIWSWRDPLPAFHAFAGLLLAMLPRKLPINEIRQE